MKEWTQCRITLKTRERLRAFLKSQLELHYAGRKQVPESGKPGQSEPSVDWQINQLLDRVEQHRQRGRKARAKKQHGNTDQAQLGTMAELLGRKAE